MSNPTKEQANDEAKTEEEISAEDLEQASGGILISGAVSSVLPKQTKAPSVEPTGTPPGGVLPP